MTENDQNSNNENGSEKGEDAMKEKNSSKAMDKAAETAGQIKEDCKSAGRAVKNNRKYLQKMGLILALLLVLGGIAHAMFTVEGVVTGLSGDTITVTNFWGSSDVTISEPWKSSTTIKAGDRVRIATNLQGVIIDVRDCSEREHDARVRSERNDKIGKD